MATVLITGGTGMIGEALTQLLLERGYKVIILTRRMPAAPPAAGVSYASWNVKEQRIDAAAVQKADHIIHLAGAGVAERRWSAKRKKEIIESRTKSSALLVKALMEQPNHVKSVVSASAIGWYGPDPIVPNLHPFTEDTSAAGDFLGETCRLWEDSIAPVKSPGRRLVILRTGIVLSTKAGAFKEFFKPLRFGIAAILGSGKQVISWIHIHDICRIYLKALEDPRMEGVYNAVAPGPLSNKSFTLQLAKLVRHNFFIPVYVPSSILKLVLGEMSVEVLKSTTVSADKLRSAGFSFAFPSIEAALNQLTTVST